VGGVDCRVDHDFHATGLTPATIAICVWRGGVVSAKLRFAMRKISFTVLLLAAAFAADAGAVALHVDASLIADSTSPARDAPVWIGLRMRHDAGWHTYWKNPGDAGMPTRITWTLPEGWTASGINLPAPERLQLGPLASYGYQGEVVLPVKLFPPAAWDAKLPVHISAHAAWLMQGAMHTRKRESGVEPARAQRRGGPQPVRHMARPRAADVPLQDRERSTFSGAPGSHSRTGRQRRVFSRA